MKNFPVFFANKDRDAFYRFDDMNSVIKVVSFAGATLNNLTISFAYDLPEGYYAGIAHTCESIEEPVFNNYYMSTKMEQRTRAKRLGIYV